MLAEFYRQIQVIMTILGYYNGVCNGVWGPKSIEAMKKWEATDAFEPAIPYNGRPFTGRGRLPKGFQYAGLTILCPELETDKAKELLKTPLLTVQDIEKQCGVKTTQTQEQKPVHAYVYKEPEKVAPVVLEPDSVQTETVVETEAETKPAAQNQGKK